MSDQNPTSEDLDRIVAGRTLPRAFLETVEQLGDRVALRWRNADGTSFSEWSFSEYADRVARAATGLAARGVGRGDRVVLMLRNIPEFHVLDLAVNFLGATSISIYNSSSPDQVQYLVEHSEAKLGIVEDEGFLSRFLEVRDQLPRLEALGVLSSEEDQSDRDVFGRAALFDAAPMDLGAAAEAARPEDLATVIYTLSLIHISEPTRPY